MHSNLLIRLQKSQNNILPFSSVTNDTIPVSFFIFYSSDLFKSDTTQSEVDGKSTTIIGSNVISATIEGRVITGLPIGQEVEIRFTLHVSLLVFE